MARSFLKTAQFAYSAGTGGPPNSTVRDNLARRYDLIMSKQEWYTQSDITAMRAINPDLIMLDYINGTLYGSTPGNGSPSFTVDHYLICSTGGDGTSGTRYLLGVPNFGNYYMDPKDTGWQDERATEAKVGTDKGFNGPFFDIFGGVCFNSGRNQAYTYPNGGGTFSATDKTPTAAGYSWATWRDQGLKGIADAAQAKINQSSGSQPKYVTGNAFDNGGNYLNGTRSTKEEFAFMKGGLAEVWIRNARDANPVLFRDVAGCKDDIDMLVAVQRDYPSKFIIVSCKHWPEESGGSKTDAQVKQVSRFALASYMLGAGTTSGANNAYFCYDKHASTLMDPTAEPFNSDWEHDYGIPKEAYSQVGSSNLYKRTFTKSIVLCNIGGTSASYSVSGAPTGGYTDLDGNTVNNGNISVAAHSGVILLGSGDYNPTHDASISPATFAPGKPSMVLPKVVAEHGATGTAYTVVGGALVKGSAAATTTCNVTLPAGIVSGDMILVSATTTASTTIATSNSGYTLDTDANKQNGSSVSNVLWWKRADGTESSTTFTVNVGASTRISVLGMVLHCTVDGIDKPLNVDRYGTSAEQSNVTSVNHPAVLSSNADSALVVWAGMQAANAALTWTGPTNFTNADYARTTNASGNNSITGMALTTVADAGSHGPYTSTLSTAGAARGNCVTVTPGPVIPPPPDGVLKYYSNTESGWLLPKAVKVWNGSSWAEAVPRFWDGSQWVPQKDNTGSADIHPATFAPGKPVMTRPTVSVPSHNASISPATFAPAKPVMTRPTVSATHTHNASVAPSAITAAVPSMVKPTVTTSGGGTDSCVAVGGFFSDMQMEQTTSDKTYTNTAATKAKMATDDSNETNDITFYCGCGDWASNSKGTTDAQLTNMWNRISDIWNGVNSKLYGVGGNHENMNAATLTTDSITRLMNFADNIPTSTKTGTETYTANFGGWLGVFIWIKDLPTASTVTWINTQLTNHGSKPSFAVIHYPRYNAGNAHSSGSPNFYGNGSPDSWGSVIWPTLMDHKVEFVVSGHEHLYQRWARMDNATKTDSTNGVRQFVCPTASDTKSDVILSPPSGTLEAVGAYAGMGYIRIELWKKKYRWRTSSISGGNISADASWQEQATRYTIT